MKQNTKEIIKAYWVCAKELIGIGVAIVVAFAGLALVYWMISVFYGPNFTAVGRAIGW